MRCSCGRPLTGRQRLYCSIPCRRARELTRRHERAARAVETQWLDWQAKGWAPIDVRYADATVDQYFTAAGQAAEAYFREADPVTLEPWHDDDPAA